MSQRENWLVVTPLLGSLLTFPLVAQQTGSVTGVIRDQSDSVLAGVEVVVVSANRSTFSNSRGAFRLDSLQPGRIMLLARMPGYSPQRIQVTVGGGEVVEVALVLSRIVQVLEDIEITERRRGLYGIVADTGKRPLVGARVQVHGAGSYQDTDSLGRFAFPRMTPGTYAVMVTHPEYESRRVHLTIPAGESREIVVFLVPGSENSWASYRLREAMHDMGVRLAYYPSRFRLTEVELAKYAGKRLCDVPKIPIIREGENIRKPKAKILNVIVNGTDVFWRVSLCDWSVDEIALAEWGWNCRDVTGGVERLLGPRCEPPPPPSSIPLPPYGVWVMIWTKQ